MLHQALREGAPRPDSDGRPLKQRKVPWDLFTTNSWRAPGSRQDSVGPVCRNAEWGHVQVFLHEI